MQTFWLKWPCLLAQINEVTSTDTSKKLEALLEKHEEVFRAGLGTYSGPPVSIFVDADAVPKFCPARSVPYAWRGAVDSQLSRMEDEGIIESVAHAEWASPIVPVIKDDGTVRVCGDYKRTLNQVCIVDQYLLPRIEDMFATLARGQKFTKIDLTQAYTQLTLDEKSRPYTTINTSKGLYQFKRMPFGVASATAIF